METVFAERSSWTALTWHIRMKTASKAKNIKSKCFGDIIMKILTSESDSGKSILKAIQHITTRNS